MLLSIKVNAKKQILEHFLVECITVLPLKTHEILYVCVHIHHAKKNVSISRLLMTLNT